MIKLLILGLAIYFIYRSAKNWLLEQANPNQSTEQQQNDNSDIMIKDPQCGIYFPQREGLPLSLHGQTLYFCSEKCRAEYKQKHQ